MVRTSNTFTGQRIVRELSENFSKPTSWPSCALLERERATFNRAKKKTLYGAESFKGTCTLLLSFFLEVYTRLFFFHLGGGGQKKTTTPYFTRARFVQPRRKLRTRILQRYLYSISFFLSRTLHWSFLLSSRGWWTKKNTTPYFTRARFDQPRTLRIRALQRYMCWRIENAVDGETSSNKTSCLSLTSCLGNPCVPPFIISQCEWALKSLSPSWNICTLFLSFLLSRTVHSSCVFSSFI